MLNIEMINLYRKIRTYFFIFLGNFLIYPISLFFKLFTSKKYIVFIGTKNGLFLDNVKYLFLYFIKNKNKLGNYMPIFLTEDENTYSMLKRHNLPVVKYPSLKGIKILFSAKLVIVDSLFWFYNFKGYILRHIPKIQLWHGVGLKYIELQNKRDPNFKNFLSILKSILNCRYPKYDVVITTSKFYAEKVFSKAFRTKEIWITGYPRNDIFFRNLDKYDLINTDKNILKLIKDLKKEGKRIILYAPTFRDTGRNPFEILNLKKLDKFLKKINAIMLIKPHPFFYIKTVKDHLKNIFIYDPNKDIYPLMKFVDLLITDYSSIYMDYLLLDKPIIFFPYDLTEYISKDRDLQFNYNWITPGKKVYTQEELEKEIFSILKNKEDKYRKKREEIRKLAFDFVDGNSSQRIYNKIVEKYLDL